MSDATEIVFGRDANQVLHTFRHTDDLGLDRVDVIDAVRADLVLRLPLQTQLLVGSVTVGGIELRYHAYPVAEGLVNVGRITGP